jgi:putative ABC transport system ATP-binding protein
MDGEAAESERNEARELKPLWREYKLAYHRAPALGGRSPGGRPNLISASMGCLSVRSPKGRWYDNGHQQAVRQGMSALVEIRNLSKVYERGRQTIEVLHHVQLDIEAGDFMALMGPSGSGKTTLLNLIGGLDSPTDGSITIGGQRIDRLSENALAKWRSSHVGFVFQFYNLLPMLSARRNVELPLLLTKLSAAQRKRNAAIALQLVGLADRAAHKPSELSGGQQQRVAIARAIVSDPTLLVCDEPTGDLDRQSAADVLTLLQQLNRDHGKTIIMVTHDPKAAEFAKHTLQLDKGSLVASVASAPA